MKMTKEDFFKNYVGNGTTVNCETIEEAKELMALAKAFGFKWKSGQDLSVDYLLQHYGEVTTYEFFNSFTVMYADVKWDTEKGKTVVKFNQLKGVNQLKGEKKYKVFDTGTGYTTYTGFFYGNNLRDFLKDYDYGNPSEIGEIVTIEAKGKHRTTGTEICVLRSVETGKVYLNVESSLKLVVGEVSKFKKFGNVENVEYVANKTIVTLADGRKGVAICCPTDTFDKEIGFALAYARAVHGNFVPLLPEVPKELYVLDEELNGTLGKVGTKTKLTDIHGNRLYIGDLVVDKDGDKAIVCQDKDGAFIMGIKVSCINNCERYRTYWKVRKVSDYTNRKVGETFEDDIKVVQK